MGLAVEETTLDFGDLAFTGKGVGGRPVSVGIEFKKLGECVSALRTGRLQGHQRPGMYGATGLYDYCWLLVEGELLYDKAGHLQRRAGKRVLKPLPGGMGVSELLKRIQTLHLCGGLNPWWTQNRADTLKFIEALYRTWTDQDLDKHKSHLAIYQAPTLVPPTRTQAAFNAWPTIGMKTSAALERHFGSVRRASNATVEELAGVEILGDKGKVRKLGMKDAMQIHSFLNGK